MSDRDLIDRAHYANMVVEGAARMDAAMPGWERHVDVSTLDMMDGCDCVIGQVGQVVLEKLGGVREFIGGVFELPDGRITTPWTWMRSHHDLDVVGAFSAPETREIWTDLIKERFNTGALSDA